MLIGRLDPIQRIAAKRQKWNGGVSPPFGVVKDALRDPPDRSPPRDDVHALPVRRGIVVRAQSSIRTQEKPLLRIG